MAENEILGQDIAAPMQPVAVQQPAEKMIPQSEVNELVGRVRQDGYQRGLAEAQQKAQVQQPMSQAPFSGMSEDKVRDMIIEQTRKAQQEQAMQIRANQIVQDFAGKMSAGGGKYQDFEEKVAALDLPKIPQIVQLAASADNTADVMYELANNPHKIASLLTLARETPHLAHIEMQKLSNSIKANQQAAESVQTREPLSTIKPSSAPSDKGPMTVSDYRRAKWARR